MRQLGPEWLAQGHRAAELTHIQIREAHGHMASWTRAETTKTSLTVQYAVLNKY